MYNFPSFKEYPAAKHPRVETREILRFGCGLRSVGQLPGMEPFTFHALRFTFHALRFTLYALRFTFSVLRRCPGLRGPVVQPGHHLDHGGLLGRQCLPDRATDLVGVLHANAATAHLLADPCKTDRFEAIQLLRLTGPIAIHGVNVGYALREAIVIVDDRDGVDVVAARRLQL